MQIKKIFGVVLLGAAVTTSSAALAAGDRAFNTAAGAVIGAAIGSQTGNGTTGTVVGGVVGGVLGNAISSGDRDRHHDRGYQGRGYAQPQPVYYEAPRPRYVREAPVYVDRRPVVREYYVQERGHGRGHGYGHRKHHHHD